jgi:hypothetical protein
LDKIRAYAFERAAEKSQGIVDNWKRDDVYSYKGEAADPVEAIERQVFGKRWRNLSITHNSVCRSNNMRAVLEFNSMA